MNNINSLSARLLKNPNINQELASRLSSMGFIGAEGGLLVSADAMRTVPGTNTTVDGQSLSEIWQDLQSRLSAFNRGIDFIVSLFTFPVERATEKVGVPTTAKFEEATEFGRPQKIRLAYVSRGFPLTHRDLAYGYTQEFIDSARGADIQSLRVTVENAWRNELLTGVLTALFSNVNLTDDDGVSVKRLYNNDGEVPPAWKRTTHAGTHTHYLTSGAASFDAADVAAIEEHLIHHGYGDSGEQFVLFVNRTEMATMVTLTGWVPAATSTRPTIVNGTVVGQTGAAPSGLSAEGYIGRFAVVVMDDIPAGYLLAMSTGGSLSGQNPVGYRRHENPSIRGLRLIEGPRQNYPIVDAVYDGYAGFGVRHRGGAVVMQVTAGAYAIPTL